MKPGDVVFVKTTNEEVFILGLTGNRELPFPDEIGPFSGTTAIVRRPSIGQGGVTYVLDFFLIEELESLEDRVRREKSQQDRVRKTMEELTGEAKTAAGLDVN